MQILAVAGIITTFALLCAAIYFVARSLQRRGRDLTFVDPRYPESMQGVQPTPNIAPPGHPYPADDTSLAADDGKDAPPWGLNSR
jgi:hypothetical protein